MATTNAKFTLATTDLVSDQINFNISKNLAKAPYGDGCNATTGLMRVAIASGGLYAIQATDKGVIRSTAVTTPGTNFHKNYLYVKNVETDNVTLKIMLDGSSYSPAISGDENCDFVIGMLEKDDWMFIPWSGNIDIVFSATTSAECLMEYMIVN
jgi:hypothetical protein